MNTNKMDIIAKLNENGIYHLRKDESVADALKSVENGTNRVGCDFKHRDGSLMTQNEIIATSNKESFSKTVRKPEYIQHLDVNVEDIPWIYDLREDESAIGEIQPCQYCGKPLRVDEGAEFTILNCEDCMSYAIWRNCM